MKSKLIGLIGLALLAGFAILYRPVASFQSNTVARQYANGITVTATTISWEPAVAYEQATLMIVGSNDFVLEKTFAATDPLTLEIQNRLTDGAYTFEWRLTPIIDQAVLNELRNIDSLETRNARVMELQAAGVLPTENLNEYGYFTIANGAILLDTEEPAYQAEADTSAQGTDGLTPQGVITSDTSIQGSLCVGTDCVSSENFGFDTIRIKENNLRIKFDDTSNSGSFPNNDWQLAANDTNNGGANRFSIEDVSGNRIPFTIEAGTPNNSLYLDSSGNVGFGKSTPVVNLHTVDGNTPTLRLEQDGSSGFTAQTWDVAGNEAVFFVRDVTNASRIPFKIKPGAPTGSLFIAANGDVGLGTENPDTTLDIQNANASIRVATSNNTADEIMTFDTNGNLTISGLLTEASDKSVKENFTAVDSVAVLEQIVNMPITMWNYISDEDGTLHMGPMAQDFYAAFGLGVDDKHIAPLDANGVAFAGIQGLFELFQTQDAELDALQQENDELKTRIDELEAAVDALLKAQNAQGE
ncbi:MAG: tail fiber domain-containing protein [Anaerolineales bacterium]|nr:tail fiber domain-containing protein [Anaerolineales bacterium]